MCRFLDNLALTSNVYFPNKGRNLKFCRFFFRCNLESIYRVTLTEGKVGCSLVFCDFSILQIAWIVVLIDDFKNQFKKNEITKKIKLTRNFIETVTLKVVLFPLKCVMKLVCMQRAAVQVPINRIPRKTNHEKTTSWEQ